MLNQTTKERYKQTELGIIPTDWEVDTLQNLSEKIMVGIASAATHAYREKGVILFRNQNIKSCKLDDEDILFIAEDYEQNFSSKRLKAGDLLTARTGYPGTTCIIPEKYEGAQSFTTLITRPKKDKIRPEYLNYFINSEIGQQFFTKNKIGGGQKNVNVSSLRNMLIAYPPNKEEQIAITQILSNVDRLTESFEILIEKKKCIKQGSMQELLTGKKLLSGIEKTITVTKSNGSNFFPEKWAVMKIGDMLKVRHGKSQREITSENGKYPILATGGEIGRTDEYLYNKPSVLIGRKGTIDKPKYIENPFWTVDTLFYTEVFDGFSPKFLFYKFCSIDWYSHNEASGVPSLNAKTIEGIEVLVPLKLEEQKAIARVLSDMDSEIKMLEHKRDKYLQLKVGLMQQLLTGRIRLACRN